MVSHIKTAQRVKSIATRSTATLRAMVVKGWCLERVFIIRIRSKSAKGR